MREAVERQDKAGITDENNMLSLFLKRGVPKHQVDAELVIALSVKQCTSSFGNL